MQKKLKIGTVKKQDILENRVKIVLLGLGSNLGNRLLNIEKAKFLLTSNQIIIMNISSYYETDSCPDKTLPKYLNIIVQIKTNLSLLSLFNKIKSIEKKLGRKKMPRNFPRKCDIDIIDFDHKISSIRSGSLNIQIPHPRLHKRNFVLIPLFEVANKWTHPKLNEKITYLLSKISIYDLRSIKLI